jgi:hypothetical protein
VMPSSCAASMIVKRFDIASSFSSARPASGHAGTMLSATAASRRGGDPQPGNCV